MNLRSYLFPVLLALILHSVILSALFYSWFGYAEDEKQLVPRHVKAQIVDIKSQLKAQQQDMQAEARRKEEARRQAERKEEARKKEARKKEALKQAEAKKKEDARKQAEAKRKAENKKKADALKKQEALKQEALKKEAARKKAEALKKDAQKKEALKQEALQKKQQDEARRKAEAQQEAERKSEQQRVERELQEQKRRESELAAAMAAEEREMQALATQQATAGYLEYIASEIESNWSRPPSARNGMKVVLSLHLLPTGEVDNVYVVESSGDSHFDDSAIRAVKRVGRFTELQKMDPILFDRNFRKLSLEYKPSDLRR